jgi:hypothetical protein
MDYVCIEVGIMTVTLPYDPHWKALEWAKENCPSYCTNSASGPPKIHTSPGGWVTKYSNDIVYYFSDEKDAVLFALRWL